MTQSDNYAANYETFEVSAKRFAPSPWLEAYRNDAMILGVYSGRFYPLSLGKDPMADYWNLRRKAVLFDVPEHPIEISGPDALAFCQKLFCRDVSKLKVGRATYAIACNGDGGIIMDGVLMRLAPERYFYVKANGEFLLWMDAMRAQLDVQISDPESWVLQVQGPLSMQMLPDLLDTQPPEPFKYFDVAECRVAGEPFLISRSGWTGELGFELYSMNPEVDGVRVFEHIMQAGRDVELSFSSLESMGIRRIEAGIMDNGEDLEPGLTPYAAGLGRFVDLDKPEFVGREALVQADKRCRLFGVTADASAAAGRHRIYDGNREVGHMTAGARSPYLDKVIGYAKFSQADDWLGRSVVLVGDAGERFDALVVELPFFDKSKRLPRGLPLDEELAP